jgi:ABC-2 type transport system ATP-binding protein
MIQIENLWKMFGSHTAVRDLTLTVPEGSAYALIGANGAGKTTTIKIILNILAQTRGTVRVMGIDSRKISPREFQSIGYLSENQELPERLSVEEYFNYLRPFYSRWDCQLESSLRLQLKLPATRKIGALSHGMRMKMALACALSFHPRLLIMDEPFNGLDPLVRDELMDGLLGQAGDITILISSHELNEIEGIATHIAFVDDGKLLFDEPKDALSSRFRAVRIVFDLHAPSQVDASDEWIHLRSEGSVLEFVHTNYPGADFHESLRAKLIGIRTIDAEPMPLRSIFTALARQKRDLVETGGGES